MKRAALHTTKIRIIAGVKQTDFYNLKFNLFPCLRGDANALNLNVYSEVPSVFQSNVSSANRHIQPLCENGKKKKRVSDAVYIAGTEFP